MKPLLISDCDEVLLRMVAHFREWLGDKSYAGMCSLGGSYVSDNIEDYYLTPWDLGYGIMVTPVQVIAAVGALSNGGRYVPLSLRKGGAVGVEPRAVVTPQTSLNMLDLMRRNVVRGSGGRANAPGLRVGGKTGSANKWTGSGYDPAVAVGTFIGVFPADGPLDAPRYAILVLVDEPGQYPRTGGFVAAPAVGRIADRIAPFVGVERADDRWQLADGRPNPTLKDMEASL